MTPRFETVEKIFHAALDHAPDDLGAFLDERCADDEVLRGKVEELLAAHRQAGNFIETPIATYARSIITGNGTDSLIGKTIGHYKISNRIGAGGMGEVYLATDTIAGRNAALKFLPARFTDDAERLNRFQQEAHTVAALNHPNVLTVYEIGVYKSTHYIASELIQGETLRERLARGPMQLNEAIEIAIQVASALGAAHEVGIVHRDVKPENIMLRPDGYVKVLDFGIAKLAEEEVPVTIPEEQARLLTETHLHSVLGTVRYMSPEQARGASVDRRSDIWSLGVVLYEMLTARAPFKGDTTREVMSSILAAKPSPIVNNITQAAGAVQQIVNKALQKDPGERYQNANEMLDALKGERRKLEFTTELQHSAAARFWLRWRRSPAALLLTLFVGALALVFPLYRLRNPPPNNAPPEKSIAVLPFQNLSKDQENAFFADGVQDEILTRLSKISDLKVISRTSTQRYKNAPRNLRQIARQLGVSNILEGSVQKSADQVRVTVQLINTVTDSHFWAESYDRKLTDVFQVESDVAQKIAAALEAKLTGREKSDISSIATQNPQAYEAYLRAVAVFRGYDSVSLQHAVQAAEEAVVLDPSFAAAWALLAKIHALTYFQGFDRTEGRRIAATRAVEKAIGLQPDLAETQMAKGFYEYWILQEYDAARGTFEQLRSRWPNNAEIVETLGYIARRQGHWKEGREYLDVAIALNPRDLKLRGDAAETRANMRDFPAALRTIDQALAVWPDDTNLIAEKASVYQALGQLDQADLLLSRLHPKANDILAVSTIYYQAMLRRDPAPAITLIRTLSNPPNSLSPIVDVQYRLWLGKLARLAGNTVEAKASFTQARDGLEKELKHQSENAWLVSLLAQALEGVGEREAALRAIDRAVELSPSSKDARSGPWFEEMGARIRARLGDGVTPFQS